MILKQCTGLALVQSIVVNRTERSPEISFRYLEEKSLCDQKRSENMTTISFKDVIVKRAEVRDIFESRLNDALKMRSAEDREETTRIHYRWYYKDDETGTECHHTDNCPGVRWHLFTTAEKNWGRFFFSTDEQDLLIDEKDPTRPRIGPYAPPVPRRGSWNSSHAITAIRLYKLKSFD